MVFSELVFASDFVRARFGREYHNSVISIDPEIADIDFPLSEKVNQRVYSLKPYASDMNFDSYKVALVELGIETDNYYQNDFLQNMDSSESTKDKTSRIKKENEKDFELYQLESLLDRKRGKIWTYRTYFFLPFQIKLIF